MSLTPGTRLHFIGIGGIGMSGLAEICLARGLTVEGCDIQLNASTYRLSQRGASISTGHDPRHLEAPIDLVVYSGAVPGNEPELTAAKTRGIPMISRGELLAELVSDHRLIAIAGSHGKTTTSAIAAELLECAGWDPTVIIGGLMRSTGTNAKLGTGSYLVAETDESDGSFLRLFPDVAVVTNVDREHLNHYETFGRLVEAFQQFVGQMAPGGTLIRCIDDPLVCRLLTHPSQLSYGMDPDADVTVSAMSFHRHEIRFKATYHGRSLSSFTLRMAGRHNVLNALAIVSLGLTLDIPLVTIREVLAEFRGTYRRFHLVELPGDLWFIEDYAHHPAEIQATLMADSLIERRRIAVFQPHRYSRTQLLEQEFAACFDDADGVIITDIYPAFEAPISGVSGERLAQLIKAPGHPCVRYVPREEIDSFIPCITQPGDTLFFLGAGDIGALCNDMAEKLHSTRRAAR